MASLNPQNIQWLQNLPAGEITADFGQRLFEILNSYQQAIANIAGQTNASVSGVTAAPPQVSGLSVTASGGFFDVQIQDNNPVSRGITYFVEYSTTASFAQPHVVDLGAARTYRAGWGDQTLYFRAYSQYPTSAPSELVYFGTVSAPVAVNGAGGVSNVPTGPAPQASTGSGTAPNNGQTGGAGYGNVPVRGQTTLRGSFVGA